MSLLICKYLSVELQLEAVNILYNEWGGNKIKRLDKIINDNNDKCYSLLIDNKLIGYIELEKSLTNTDQLEYGIITSVIIHPDYRNNGYGKTLMNLIENIAKDKNYQYIYLWTNTANKFYEKIGYNECNPINTNRYILNKLDKNSISLLEQILINKFNNNNQSHSSIDINTKWYRKRIIYEKDFVDVDFGIICKEYSNYKHKYQIVQWQRQIGPSCGITALNIALKYYNQLNRSILPFAIESGYTIDGELFNIDNFINLCHDLLLSTITFTKISIDSLNIEFISNWFDSNNLIIIPYDRDDIGSFPCNRNGLKAHYALIIGYIHVNNNNNDYKLIGIQGLSPRLIIASLNDWIDSNKQLYCYDRHDESNLANNAILVSNYQ